jgi:hypothetical protein
MSCSVSWVSAASFRIEAKKYIHHDVILITAAHWSIG